MKKLTKKQSKILKTAEERLINRQYPILDEEALDMIRSRKVSIQRKIGEGGYYNLLGNRVKLSHLEMALTIDEEVR